MIAVGVGWVAEDATELDLERYELVDEAEERQDRSRRELGLPDQTATTARATATCLLARRR